MDKFIIGCMKERDARLSIGSRWMIVDEFNNFTVYERKPYAKKTTVIYEGDRLIIALENLEDGE